MARADVPDRALLPGVRKVAYHTDRWRFTPFCNALDACLQFLGREEQYDRLMATSGAGFRMRWAPGAWDLGNSDILGMASRTLEPMRRALESAGSRMKAVAKARPEGEVARAVSAAAAGIDGEVTDEAGFRRHLMRSIGRDGVPIIAFGVIGPPEACVVTGYDKRGDVLIGWNVFQDDEGAETEPSGEFRVRDWYPRTHGLLLFGERIALREPSEMRRSALLWALHVLRTRTVSGRPAGPAAFDHWAADMANDEYFPAGKLDVLRSRLRCHYDAMLMTAERGSVSAFLREAAEADPATAGHLLAAVDCLNDESVAHGVEPHEKDEEIGRLADPSVRREVVRSILHARDRHVEAADRIERALLAAGGPGGCTRR